MPIVPLALPTITMVALLIIPGGLLAIVLGLRGSTALAAAAPASIALIATAGLATGFLPISWGMVSVLALTAVGVLVALLLRVVFKRLTSGDDQWRGRWGGSAEWQIYLGIVLAAGLIAFGIMRSLSSADSFFPGYDNFFHMAVIRSYVEHGQATPFVPYDFSDPTGRSFTYPTAWHQLASLLITSGVTNSIPVAQNALTLASAALVWPASLFFSVRSAFKSGPALAIGTGILAASYAAFPFLPMGYGPIYPFMLGVALLPFGVGLTMQALGIGEGERLSWPMLATLGVLYLGATLMAHPNALLGWMAISVALLLALVIRQLWRARLGVLSWAAAGRTAAIAAVLITVAIIVWGELRPGPHWWEPVYSMPQAFGEFLLAAPMGRPASLTTLLLLMLGLALIARRPRYLYLLAPTLILLPLWLAAASSENPEFRHFLTGGFYNDMARLGALMPMALLPLALLPLRRADDWLAEAKLTTAKMVALLAAGTIALTYATQADRNVREEIWLLADLHRLSDESRELTIDELQMIRDMPQYVSSDDVVVADTLTGASFMYPLEGLRPIQYHPKEGLSEPEQTLMDGLSDPRRAIEVCEAVDETSADFVLDFGTDQINMDLHHAPPPGLQELEDSPLVTLVHQVGDTRLYEITGCP